VARQARFGNQTKQVSRPGQRLDNVRILIVDDTEINREVAMRIFAGEGAQVSLAEDGRQAVDWLLAHRGEVDIVLMDVQMPVMDGLAATRLIRRSPDLMNLPVIALTAGAFKAQEEAANEAGMTGFLSKPFDVDVAIALILKNTHRTASLPAPPAMASASSTPSPSGSHRDLPGLAVERGLKTWQDETAYRRYLRKFVTDFENSIDEMAQAERSVAAARAHALMGAAGNLALVQLAALTREFDHALRAGQDVASMIAGLQAAMKTACASIRLYAPDEEEKEGIVAVDSNGAAGQISPLLARLLDAFDTDDPGAINPILAELGEVMPLSSLAAIHDAVENFDFRSGEAAVLALAAKRNIAMEVRS
jgi:CheY-like chemotaxis protein